MSSGMAQGEVLELMSGLGGEAAGESRLSLLSHPAENLVQTPPLLPSQSSVVHSLL